MTTASPDRLNPYRRFFHVPASFALADNEDYDSPIFCCGDDLWNPPGSLAPTATRVIQVTSNLVDWWIGLDGAGVNSVVQLLGDSTLAWATPVVWFEQGTPAAKSYGTQVSLDPIQPNNSAGVNMLLLPQLRSPFPFWRLKFKAQSASYADIRLAIVAGGLP